LSTRKIVTKEERRLQQSQERIAHWKRWGPYLAERQWGTVREDYSPHGTAWDSFPHDHARSRAYRWGEDGIAGITDNHGRLCLALSLWNGRDPILKERLFGLTGSEGNHGEDVKEYYFYLDSTPTHSYMKYLYKYPQAAFPYDDLVAENRTRDRSAPEYELIDTGVFDADRYFDVVVEYAKAAPDDVLVRITATNRGPDAAELHLLPTLWYRNTWSWDLPAPERPTLRAGVPGGQTVIEGEHASLGARWLYCEGAPELLFAENDTNAQRLYRLANPKPWVKDSINDYVIAGKEDAVNPERVGTKAAAVYRLKLDPGQSVVTRLRLSNSPIPGGAFGREFDVHFTERMREADEFYETIIPRKLSDDARNVMRQAFGGLLWSKQFYHYDVGRWLQGDPTGPPMSAERMNGRNHEWRHLYNEDVISMPDKWEYPWYAAWDLAFHMIPLALVDPDFAKSQLVLFLREWYMHPNGQIPAYEWAFGDVNPPVHAWAALRVYRIERRLRGKGDREFLEKIFHKLLLNFTWWVNRKDAEGKNVFQGGFLGLDNIGVFDRSAPLPAGGHIEQSDATSWMGMYCLNLLAIALELARQDPAYEDVASKFFEHFVYIAHAVHDLGDQGINLWDETDGFYYDVLHGNGAAAHSLKVRSIVGLIPLFAVETLEPEAIDRLSGFKRRMQWFVDNHPEFREHVETATKPGAGVRRLLAIVGRSQLPRVLRFMLDETEFLSPHGVRAVSRYHKDHPYVLRMDGAEHRVDYEPAESSSSLFGGNSNWRGPVWFPVNYLLIESLQKFHYFYRDSLKVEFPTGSGTSLDLWQIATELSRRLTRIFLRGPDGRRPVYGGTEKFQRDPHWRDLLLFYEYFHGDNGAGMGAGHQTGWTGIVAKLLQQSGER
jgi:Mannosylglycerate hydrolase MGH1-like glycoside hydrolase domain